MSYELKDNTYFIAQKSDPKDRIQVEIGDAKEKDIVFPQIKIMRWDNEVNASFRLLDFTNYSVMARAENIVMADEKREIHLYERNSIDDIEFEDGGTEFEIVLKEKPTTNILRFSIETKGLNFFYQPELTIDEVVLEGAHRPERVIGSYAVYHATKGVINNVDGMDYKVGKVCHIFRPKFKDAVGNTIWGELNVDISNKILTITIDQKWLDSAVYPIVGDDLTFGYTSVGASFGNPKATRIRGSKYTLGTSNANVSSISVVLQNYGTGDNIIGSIYEDTGYDFVGATDQLTYPGENTWQVMTASINGLAAGDYYLLLQSSSSGVDLKYDSGGTGLYKNQAYYSHPNPLTGTTSTTRMNSIYATYTVGSSTSIKEVAGVAQASIKELSGVALASIKKVAGVSNVS